MTLRMMLPVLLVATLGGCVGRFPPLAETLAPCPAPQGSAHGPRYFVTSRALECPHRNPAPVMTISRATTLNYGSFTASGAATFAPQTSWQAALTTDARTAGRVVLFIHGYNNDFGIAARRASAVQAAGDDDAPVVLFSWPSQNVTLDYAWDENNAAWTQPDLDALLLSLTEMTDHVTIVAHSMGSRLALAALLRVQERDPAMAGRIDRVILAAPDIDRDILRRYARDDLLAHGRKVTLYVSRRDRALQTSWNIHGYARAGDPSCTYNFRRRRRRARAWWAQAIAPTASAPTTFPRAG